MGFPIKMEDLIRCIISLLYPTPLNYNKGIFFLNKSSRVGITRENSDIILEDKTDHERKLTYRFKEGVAEVNSRES